VCESAPGSTPGIRSSAEELLDLRHAEETLRKFSRVIDQTGDSVFVTDRNGTVRSSR
jgi:hypothetical protein